MKQMFKNFIVTLTKFTMASALNIIGLSVAIAVFIVIMTQLHWEANYNKSIDGSERIYRNVAKWGDDFSINISRPNGEAVGNSTPEIESYAVSRMNRGASLYQRVDQGESDAGVYISRSSVSRSFADFASLEFVEGGVEGFDAKNAVIIPESFAKTLWGNVSPLSQVIYSNARDTVRVIGVYKDMPDNCTFKNNIYIDLGDVAINDNSEWSYHYYYKLTASATPESVRKAGQDALVKLSADRGETLEDVDGAFNLEPFEGILFSTVSGGAGGGNKTLSLVLLTVAILIIVVAVINYINFFMALVPMRIRAVNINKVFGTPTSALRANFIGEALGIMAISYLLALLLVHAASGSYIAEFSDASFAFGDNSVVLWSVVAIMAVVGVFAGLFPALYITKFPPATVLKGSFGRSKSGQRLRTALTSFQFIVSMVLIIGSWFITIQTNFMRDADYGFNRDRLVTVNVGGKIASNPDAFLSELRKNPSIVDVAYAEGSVLNIGMGWGRPFKGEVVTFTCFPVSWNYPEFMEMELIDGRHFVESDCSKDGTIIFNETAAKRFGVEVGDFIGGHSGEVEVVGILSDFNFQALSNEIAPLAMYEFGSDGWRVPSNAYIRITATADFKEVTSYISNVMIALNPNIKPEQVVVSAFDETVENMYQKDQKVSDIISLFSLVAIIISLVGVFGLIVFETQYRKKEIALRKIHGSSIMQIIVMFNRRFIYLVLCSFVVAAPIAWFVVSTWLGGFAFRVPIYWWVFAAGLLAVLVVTEITVTLQTLRSASANPIDSLKTE